ncbi:MAG: protease modulator HflC [Lactobacillaceae bacterium]|jgi:membrane protease subunit HflC|nr:protease modulator HflC [Lactobacillaceae bacterium]
MISKTKISAFIALAVAAFIAFNSLYVVGQTEQAIVLQFGEPMREETTPGLKAKVPFIQNVVFYDNRLLRLDPSAQSMLLNDKKRLEVDSFTRYKIVDPLKFYKTVRMERQAESKLQEIVNSSVRKVLGKITLQELLSEKRNQIMKDISEAVKGEAKQIGVSIADVRIRRADLPLEVLKSMNERMIADREKEATFERAQGEKAAIEIKAKADMESVIIVAEARKKAEILKGEGDQEAISILTKIANSDSKFYAFYRSLEAYRKSLASSDTSLIISPESEFFEFFKKSIKTGK